VLETSDKESGQIDAESKHCGALVLERLGKPLIPQNLQYKGTTTEEKKVKKKQ